jgi:hypothetical protein
VLGLSVPFDPASAGIVGDVVCRPSLNAMSRTTPGRPREVIFRALGATELAYEHANANWAGV